ncbi:MAG: HAD family hydrolase [bacterium]
MPKRLVLFDIDGTLLTTNGHGVEAMMVAYEAVWGRDARTVVYAMSGKTELNISHELMALLGFSRAEVDAGLPDFFRRYPEELRRRIAPETTTVLPGIRRLVEAVRDDERMVLGLVTGNCEAAARVKLEVAGLDGFALGAYGEHHEERSALPPLAVAAARELFGGTFIGKSIVILGDTPNDIDCGRAVGAKTIAVGTGRFDAETLASHGPDYLFADFSDHGAVMEAILA